MTSQSLCLGPSGLTCPCCPQIGRREECWPGLGVGLYLGLRGRARGGPGAEAPRPGLTLGFALSVSAAWPRYRVVGSADSGQYNLEITDAELSDDAAYECQATEAALRSRRAKLTVLSNDATPFGAPGP